MPTTNRLSNLRKNFESGAAVSRQIEQEQTETLKEIEQVQKQSGQTAPKPGKNASISIFNLKSNPFQYLQRDEVQEPEDDEEFQALVNSIREYGYQGGIIITEIDGEYYIVQGHRRARAVRYLATHENFDPTVTVVLVELTKDQMVGFLVTSNFTSRAVSPLKTALTISYYQKQQGLSVRDIAKVTGMSKKKIENYLILNKMPEEVRQQVEDGALSINQVLELHSQDVFHTKNSGTNSKIAETTEPYLSTNKETHQNGKSSKAKTVTATLEQTKTLTSVFKTLNKVLNQLDSIEEDIGEDWTQNLLQLVGQIEEKITQLGSSK